MSSSVFSFISSYFCWMSLVFPSSGRKPRGRGPPFWSPCFQLHGIKSNLASAEVYASINPIAFSSVAGL